MRQLPMRASKRNPAQRQIRWHDCPPNNDFSFSLLLASIRYRPAHPRTGIPVRDAPVSKGARAKLPYTFRAAERARRELRLDRQKHPLAGSYQL